MSERTVAAQIEKIEEQKKQLEERLVTMKNRLKKQERVEDTRKKILVGAYFMEKYKDKMHELVPQLDRFLIRDADRELFGLKPVNGNSHLAES
jgi:predicted nuclease with TOPRIM domain